MPVNLSGNWTISVIGKSVQALPQRFIVTGAISGNGTHTGVLGNSVSIIGTNWQLNIQANEEYDLSGNWIDSTISVGSIQKIGIENVIIINSEDLVQDNSFDDLVLRLSQPAPITQPPPVPPIVIPPTLPPTAPSIPPIIIPPIVPEVLAQGKVYTKFNIDDKLPQITYKLTEGIWLDATGSNIGNMVTFFTASNDTGSYKKTIYQNSYGSCLSTPHFDIFYGHKDGSGSNDLGGKDFYTPAKAVYGQFKNLCEVPVFKLGSSEIKHFYGIQIKRDRFGDRLDEGNVELNLAELSGSLFLAGNGNRNAHTGSNIKLAGTGKILRLIDDSPLNLSTDLSQTAYNGFYQTISSSLVHYPYETFYVVSGALETGIYNKSNPHVYGLSYPKLGLWILDADLLDLSASFLTVTGSDVNGDNIMKLFRSISGSALQTDTSGDYLGFQARRVKEYHNQAFFIRVKNQDYNFSNNPTFSSGSDQLILDDLGNTYITEVGLYNENHELLAVGKISKPIKKSWQEESLLKVKLKW